MSYGLITLTLVLALPVMAQCNNGMVHEISLGGCVIPQSPQHQLNASSARMCAFLCSQLRPCIAWSYRTGACNVSDSAHSASLTNHTDCQVWSGLRQLGLVAFWPMSSAARTRNAVSNSGHLDLQENRPMQYTDSGVNFTGQFGVEERFDIDELASVCLSSFTVSVWVKFTNLSRGLMPIIEGIDMPNGFFTRIWLEPQHSRFHFMVLSPASRGFCPVVVNNDSGWTHIAAVYDKQSPAIRMYINGTMVSCGSTVSVSSCVNFGTEVQIGATTRSAGHNRVFQGFMRCFGVSQRALSLTEVLELQQLC